MQSRYVASADLSAQYYDKPGRQYHAFRSGYICYGSQRNPCHGGSRRMAGENGYSHAQPAGWHSLCIQKLYYLLCHQYTHAACRHGVSGLLLRAADCSVCLLCNVLSGRQGPGHGADTDHSNHQRYRRHPGQYCRGHTAGYIGHRLYVCFCLRCNSLYGSGNSSRSQTD